MHKFLKAAGFSDFKNDAEVYGFLRENVICTQNLCQEIVISPGIFQREYRLKVNDRVGLAAVVTMAEDRMNIDGYFPYFNTKTMTTDEPCELERITDREEYEGIIDDYKNGLALIFRVSNSMEYRKNFPSGEQNLFCGCWLSAFANEAKVILPVAGGVMPTVIRDNEHPQENMDPEDEEACDADMDLLNQADIDMFREITMRIENEDLYSLVDQTFMPTGVECDQYAVIASIADIMMTENSITGRKLYIMALNCNDVNIELCMDSEFLTGIPAVGRRLKAKIWLQGRIGLSEPYKE